MTFGGSGLPLFIDRMEEIQRCVAYLPEKAGGEIGPSYYCRDCRAKLTKVATQGYVLLDLYDLDAIQVYYVLLYLKVDGKRKVKWISTKLPVSGTSERKAKRAFDEIRSQFEKEYEEQLQREEQERILEQTVPHDARLEFSDYMNKWLNSVRSTIATATYQSYANMLKARIIPYFEPRGIAVMDLTPQDIEDFYQKVLADGCTTNTVIHYHAIIRKALQSAVRKDTIAKNPADKVDRPKKNVYHGTFYSEEEMLELFDAVEGDPLELCVKIAAYYGLRRSEVLGLRWSAIDLERKTISISHKVIEAEVNGKFVPVGEDVLKTKSSFRTLPLIPAVEKLILAEKEKQEMYRRLFKKSYCRDYLEYICVDQCGRLLRPNYVTEHFSWIIEKYGLRKIRFHDLRHTCASLLLNSGENITMKQIQIWLGHSTYSTTADIYAHLDHNAQQAPANTMNGMFIRGAKDCAVQPI